MKLQQATTQEEAVQEAAHLLMQQLIQLSGQETTLLLSGGSADLIYRQVRELTREVSDLSWLQIGLVDERAGKPAHEQSNQLLVQKSGLVEAWEKKGAHFHWVLSQSPEEYEKWLTQRFHNSPVLAVMGVGADGHTAGILPFEDSEAFEAIFSTGRNFVQYEYPGTTEFPRRLTLTPQALLRLKWVVGVMWGEKKEPVWEKLQRKEFPGVALFPSQLLSRISGTLLYGK